VRPGLLLAMLGAFHHCLSPVMISSVIYYVILQIFSFNKQANIKSNKNLVLKTLLVYSVAGYYCFKKEKKKTSCWNKNTIQKSIKQYGGKFLYQMQYIHPNKPSCLAVQLQ